ncbi:MAG: chemotaxis protein CheA [Candidatus Aenigmarchaeota archaeon]|nr:chemotaxis protein CheA [Candidatus Aenigmarchaeota archaeon]
MALTENKKYLEYFLAEANEIVQKLDGDILELEKNPKSKNLINDIFRVMHTLKGNSAAVGLKELSELCHAAEDLFDLVRGGKEELIQERIEVLFAVADAIKKIITDVSKGVKKEYELQDLIEILKGNKDVSELKSGKKPEELEIRTVKVEKEKLDRMMSLIGELMITKIRLNSLLEGESSKDVNVISDQIDRLIDDIKYNILEMSMVPVAQVFNHFPRVVRDLSKERGKLVDLVIEDNGLELDRSVLDEINEVLIHLLRNSVDHGIESPEERKKKNKSKGGKIVLASRREKNSAIIEVYDDGRGFDPELIKKVAVEKKIITQKQAEKISEDKILQLAFSPGFTTSASSSSISGRGVGLGAVKDRISNLNGSIKIESEKDKGSRIIIKTPLSVAIIPSFIVSVSENSFAIPISNVLHVLDYNEAKIKKIKKAENIIWRKEFIPLVYLNQLFNLQRASKNLKILIAEIMNEKRGVVVDEILSKREVVVKNLSQLSDKNYFSGTTILDDGSPTLIIDLNSLLK